MKLIVCVDMEWGIGYKNELLFDIPMDKAFFKKTTFGHTIVMGKNTWDSLPMRPLPGRHNIVFSRDYALELDGASVVHSLGEFLNFAKSIKNGLDDVFVIGGEQIYKLLLPYCDEAYVTKVFETKQADAYMTDLDELENWVSWHVDMQYVDDFEPWFCRYINTDFKSLDDVWKSTEYKHII